MKERGWSLLGAGVVTPWCCVAPAALSLVGITGLSVGVLTRIETALFPYMAILAVILIGRAHYLLYAKGQGNRMSRIVTWGATALVGVMVGVKLVLGM